MITLPPFNTYNKKLKIKLARKNAIFLLKILNNSNNHL